jgi:hypothetical protein
MPNGWEVAIDEWIDGPTLNVSPLPGLVAGPCAENPSISSSQSQKVSWATGFMPTGSFKLSYLSSLLGSELDRTFKNTSDAPGLPNLDKLPSSARNLNQPSRLATIISSKPTKRTLKETIPGYQCFSQWLETPDSPAPPPKRANVITSAERRGRQDLKEKGSCLRCRMYKLKVNTLSF